MTVAAVARVDDQAEALARLEARATVGLRRTSGTWLIAHAHCSAPFDPASGAAMLGLAPQDARRDF